MRSVGWAVAGLGIVACVACSGGNGGGGGGGATAHALQIKVSGKGTVESAAPAFTCKADCSQTIAGGQIVLSATADAGNTFAGWQGDCSGTGACTVSMDADHTVTALFSVNQPPPPPGNFRVTVNLTGAGSGHVTSSPAGIDCPGTCATTAQTGAAVTLTAQPAAGSTFAGWGGGCHGAATCAMTSTGDVWADFEPGPAPPPPSTFTVKVNLIGNGSGRVTSAPAGIDCPGSCSMTAQRGRNVTLTAQAASGSSFTGWGGACRGPGTCTLGSDGEAWADFEANAPPPPPDDCAGLMPASMPAPVVASLPQNDCLDGTSDDGTGNYALGYTAGSGPNYPNYLFFTIQNGQAVRIGGTVPGGDESSTAVYSQPSGFTSYEESGFTAGSSMTAWSHEGQPISTQRVASVDSTFQHIPSSALDVDPSGGIATLVHDWDSAAGNWRTYYKRYDKSGVAETGAVVLDHRFPADASAIVVALSGHALAIEGVGNNQYLAQWLARDGTALTGTFPIFLPSFPLARFLMDGSVVVGYRAGFSPSRYANVTWSYQIKDGAAAAGPAPAWLTQRPADAFWPIRGGKGYAMAGGTICGAGSIEILASATAKSCGCVAIPNASNRTSVGRDGSLIVPRGIEQFGTCRFDLYPQLLK